MQTRLLVVAVLISTLMSVQSRTTGGSTPADIVYGKPGQLVAVDGSRLNLYCMGSGSPAVVFDSGWEDWAPSWSIVQPQISRWTRACSYDRAGAGFSDPGAMPRTSVRIAQELHSALHHAGMMGPYILVGHAFGGDNVRTFADLFMSDAYISEMEEMERDEDYLEQHRRTFGSRPIRVLTSGNHGVGHLETKPADTPEHLKYEQATTQAQARWLELSSNAKQTFAHHSSEYIQLDEPQTVIHAVREVYQQLRTPLRDGTVTKLAPAR